MRKVLLATTALVAVNITAAQADISIGGSVQFEVSDDGTATAFTDDSNVQVTGKNTTDSGLNLTAVVNLTGQGTTNEDAYLEIGGEFGAIRMGNTDDALDRFDGAIPSNFDHEGFGQGSATNGRAITATAIGGDSDNVSFVAPAMGGATVYGTTTAEGAMTGMGINYSASGVTVMYQAGQDGQNDETAVAANVTMAGVTLGVGQVDRENAGAKTKYRSVGAKYTMGAADFRVVNQKLVGGEKYTSLGVKYTVAPGLSVVLETSDNSVANGADNSYTYAHVNVAF